MTTLGPLQTVSVPTQRTRRQRMTAPVLTTGGLVLAAVALRFRDPHGRASWGMCPSALLGFSCPGCGGLRAVNDLGNGQIGAAFSSNFAFMVLLPLIVVVLGIWATDQWRGTRTRLSPMLTRVLAVGVLGFLVTFTVLRNLPFGAWLAP